MSTPDLHRLEQLLERWESLEEDDQKPWLEALRTEDEATWNVFLRMAGESGKTRVDAISRRLWTSLDLEAGRIGQTIHQYTIRNVVDGGGMGIVYRAWDMRLNRMVALKFLRQADLEGILMARLGRIEDALRTANQLEPTSPTLAAAIHLELGQTEWALSQLEYAVEIRDAYLTTIKAWPGTDPVREHPRFKTVLERMNLHGE